MTSDLKTPPQAAAEAPARTFEERNVPTETPTQTPITPTPTAAAQPIMRPAEQTLAGTNNQTKLLTPGGGITNVPPTSSNQV